MDTGSCTYGAVHPWFSVDLEAAYDIAHVTVMNDLNSGSGNYRRTSSFLLKIKQTRKWVESLAYSPLGAVMSPPSEYL